jgi:hypothetical protein
MLLPQLLQLDFVFWRRGPNTILDRLVHIIVIGRTNYKPNHICGLCITLGIDIFEVRKSVNNGVEIVWISRFEIRPSLINCIYDLTGAVIRVHRKKVPNQQIE